MLKKNAWFLFPLFVVLLAWFGRDGLRGAGDTTTVTSATGTLTQTQIIGMKGSSGGDVQVLRALGAGSAQIIDYPVIEIIGSGKTAYSGTVSLGLYYGTGATNLAVSLSCSSTELLSNSNLVCRESSLGASGASGASLVASTAINTPVYLNISGTTPLVCPSAIPPCGSLYYWITYHTVYGLQ